MSFRVAEGVTRPARVLFRNGDGSVALVVFLAPGDDAARLLRPLAAGPGYVEAAWPGSGVGCWAA